MSSGFSVDSINPPKRARTDREILLNSPMLSPILHQQMYDLVPGSQIPAPVYVRRSAAKGSKYQYERETQYNRCCRLAPRRRLFVANPAFICMVFWVQLLAFRLSPKRPISRRNWIPGHSIFSTAP